MRVLLLPVATALLAAGAGAPAAAQTPAGYQLSFLHVAPAGGGSGLAQIRDDAGRSVLLRGVNVNGLEDYWQDSSTPLARPYPVDPTAYAGGACPARNPAVESMAVCALDFPQMRALGYDSIRLAVSWSLLEPQPGHIDTGYIDRIAQVVGWAAADGIYSVIDMHQDAWSKYLYTASGEVCPPPFKTVGGFHESDGAPAWASAHVGPVCALAGVRELDVAVQEDFQRFWSDTAAADGIGLQEHFAGAVLALAQRFHDNPAVAGYELFNEPSPGFVAPVAMDAAELFPFYAKVISTLTGHVAGFRQLVFVEPDITRDITDESLVLTPWSLFSSYPDVVYAPHVYTRVFTPDADLNTAAGTPTFFPLNGGYESAVRDARALGLPLWVGEFGNDVSDDGVVLRAHYVNQDADAIGSSLWVWKGDGFSVYHGPFGTGVPYPSRVKFTARAYPVYTAGTLRSVTYDPDTATFDIRATSAAVAPGDVTHATVVFVPAASVGTVLATGATLQTLAVPGGRLAVAFPTGGDYRIFLGAAGGAAAGVQGAAGTAGSVQATPNTAGGAGAALPSLAALALTALVRRRRRQGSGDGVGAAILPR